MIYSFYSYKGGVGRTMALANLAELFYRQGLKVLVVDWDLEAPGLERFFPCDLSSTLQHPGVIDMLGDYKQRMTENVKSESSESEAIASSDLFPKIKDYILDVYPDNSKKGSLLLMPAGKRFEDQFEKYAYAVRAFDWLDFYENWEGELYLEWVRRQLNEIADIVLIDSRTGVTEMGGVCIFQFADVLVMLCAPNQQNLDGTNEIARNVLKANSLKTDQDRKIEIVVIPSRVEDRAENRLLNQFQNQFTKRFDPFCPKIFQDNKISLWDLKIPHVPYYAYNEEVAVRNDQEDDLAKAYKEVFSSLALLSPELRLQQAARNLLEPKEETIAKRDKTSSTMNKKRTSWEQQIHIALWGPTGSGKDWLIKAFAKDLGSYNDRDFYYSLDAIIPGEKDPEPILPESINLINVPPTPIFEDQHFVFSRIPLRITRKNNFSSFKHDFIIHNDKGQNLVDALIDPDSFEATFMTLLSAQNILITLDPLHLEENQTSDYISKDPLKLEENQESNNFSEFPDISRFGWSRYTYQKMVSNLFRILSGQDSSNRHVAICLTKMDQIPLARSPLENLRALFGVEMYRIIQEYKKAFDIEVFSTSSAGYLIRTEGGYIPNFSGGSLIDPNRWRPVNVASPFFWIFEKIERESIRQNTNWLRRIFGPNINDYIPYPPTRKKFNP
jgi:MinD-like ATPase involved in chromosome partitioning or flagellar assembly